MVQCTIKLEENLNRSAFQGGQLLKGTRNEVC